jgi:iron complex outermembrane receptor protein
MRPFTPKKLALAISAQMALTAGVTPVATAQEAGSLEEVVVTGTRREARSVYDSAAPIDVIGGDDFRNQGGTDMTDLIRTAVPSFNVNTQPISDAATVIRPANLRNLAPDHTLVLVNGKRRHRASVITWLGNGVSDGSQGPDISVIPSIALKQLEVLRDGASAQYGSDAIAGVMNFILKDDNSGGSIEAKYGEYDEEGENVYSIAGNIGLPFTDNGFFNASFEYGEQDDTDRSVQRNDAAGLIAGGNTDVANPAQIWGSPEVSDDIKTIFNMAVDLSDDVEAYAFGNYAYKEVDGGFYFRNPDTRGGVFSPDGGVTRLVGDITGDMSGNCPTDLAVGDDAGLQAVIADPNCFVFNEMFPGGFTPRFGADVKDASLFAGVRGSLDSGLTYDFSASFGWNDSDFFIYNTVNASLGPQTPTNFDPGDYTQTEYNVNADFSYPLAVDWLSSDLNIAGGVEYRDERFEITAGDEASFSFGELAEQGFSAASNGFPGFSALIAGDWNRSNVAAYIDLEADVTDRWLMGAALRWEDFDDFGSTLNGKVSTRFEVTDWLALRATYSTGFRAPTPGQSNAFNVSTTFNLELGDLINEGVVPPTNPVAQTRGGTQLDEEESTNISAGFVLQYENLSLTVDYYKIDVDDRIALSQNFVLTDEERQDLIDSGVTAAANIREFRFFVNDFDSETEGVDVVGTYSLDWSAGVTDVNVAYNNTTTDISGFDPSIIDDTRIEELENGLPESRYTVGATHLYESWRFMLRYNWTDEWYDGEDLALGDTYSDYWTMDAEVSYTFEDLGLSLVAGANNLTDETPDSNRGAADGVGNAYSQFAPLGFNGALYYGRVIYNF